MTTPSTPELRAFIDNPQVHDRATFTNLTVGEVRALFGAARAEAAALDVDVLAEAEHRSYPRDPAVQRIEWSDLSDAEKAMWRRHAANHVREYARILAERGR